MTIFWIIVAFLTWRVVIWKSPEDKARDRFIETFILLYAERTGKYLTPDQASGLIILTQMQLEKKNKSPDIDSREYAEARQLVRHVCEESEDKVNRRRQSGM